MAWLGPEAEGCSRLRSCEGFTGKSCFHMHSRGCSCGTEGHSSSLVVGQSLPSDPCLQMALPFASSVTNPVIQEAEGFCASVSRVVFHHFGYIRIHQKQGAHCGERITQGCEPQKVGLNLLEAAYHIYKVKYFIKVMLASDERDAGIEPLLEGLSRARGV